jgi:hypothetical protein
MERGAFVEKPEACYRVQKSPPGVPVLNQVNSIQSNPPHPTVFLSQIHLNLLSASLFILIEVGMHNESLLGRLFTAHFIVSRIVVNHCFVLYFQGNLHVLNA